MDFVLREKALLCQEYDIKLSALTDGTKSIRHVAEKYGGELQMKKENDRFILDILLPVPETGR